MCSGSWGSEADRVIDRCGRPSCATVGFEVSSVDCAHMDFDRRRDHHTRYLELELIELN
ncbi:MAG TPA: hypothetical protein VKP30_17455 [Polyangiaceae bacterium]|nr:hypothetical protein [Polyangiaceae bacterium]